MAIWCLLSIAVWGQASFTEPTKVFVMHSSGNHLEKGTDGGGWIEAPTKGSPQQMTIIPDGQGYYNIQVGEEQQFLAIASPWNTTFVSDGSVDEAKFSIEQALSQFVKLRCKANDKYLGTDSNDAHSKVFSDKNGSDVKHQWYFSDKVNEAPPSDPNRSRMFHCNFRRKKLPLGELRQPSAGAWKGGSRGFPVSCRRR